MTSLFILDCTLWDLQALAAGVAVAVSAYIREEEETPPPPSIRIVRAPQNKNTLQYKSQQQYCNNNYRIPHLPHEWDLLACRETVSRQKNAA